MFLHVLTTWKMEIGENNLELIDILEREKQILLLYVKGTEVRLVL